MSTGRSWSTVKGWRHFLLARNFDVNLASGSGKVRYPCCVQWRGCYVIMRKVTRYYFQRN